MSEASAPSSKPPCSREDALAVLRRLREAGHVAYFAGGCVRDELLGLKPADYDVATDAPPARVRELFSQTQAVGAAFGVILVRHRRSTVEVATFRSEGNYHDGRRPESVRFTTPEEDARRRDFTINGLFLDPVENRVIDYVGGKQDLAARVLRAIGDADARFGEDHLRLLRAVRFAARFDLSIDHATAAAIRAHAPQLARISPERIADELRAMLTPLTRVRAWEMLWEFSLLPVILRFLPHHSAGRPYRGGGHGEGDALFPSLAPGEPVHFGLALAALTLCYRIHAGGLCAPELLLTPREIQTSVQSCRKALRISNEETEVMRASLEVMPLLEADPPTLARLKRFRASTGFEHAWRLLAALLAAYPDMTRIIWLRERFAELEDVDCAPPPLITGDDLLAIGMAPGPAFKRILDAVYDAQLEHRITTRDEAMALARSTERA